MRKFYEKIVNNPKKIILIFFVMVFLSAIGKIFISVNYDIHDYLPEDSPSTISIDVMKENFDGGIPNARVMIKNVNIPQAIDYKNKIKAIDGVTDVIWLDDVLDISVPVEVMDKKILDNYYKDNNALFTVTIDDDKRIEVVDKIDKIIGENNAITGSAVSTAMATETTVKEVSKISVIAVIFVLFVLILTTTSWVEPIVVLIGLGVAIIINAGTNLIFGEISFVTNAAGNILQLAVSLDYSIFLIHRFVECKKDIDSAKEAMVVALTKSTSSIFSSGLTTIIGFLALALMRFRIGPDLGIALAKGITISLITVFIFMPPLILMSYKYFEKTHHKDFLPSFKPFGKLITKVMFFMVFIFVLAIVPSYKASNSNSFYYGQSRVFGPNTRLGRDTLEIEKTFGKNDTYVLLVPKGNIGNEQKLSDDLKKISQVSTIISYVDTVGAEIPTGYLDKETLAKLESDKYRRMVISIKADYEGEETFKLIEDIEAIAKKYYGDSYFLAGEGISTYDLKNTVTKDMVKVNLIAIGAVFIVLVLSLKSLILPFILVLGIETAIWINLAIPYFQNSVIFYIAYLIMSSIQLGATVDYAILFTERYKENRTMYNKKNSIINTVGSVTTSILTSGSALTVVGFLLGKISTHGLISQLGYFLGKGTICSMIIVFFVLPGLLYIFDKIIARTSKDCKFIED